MQLSSVLCPSINVVIKFMNCLYFIIQYFQFEVLNKCSATDATRAFVHLVDFCLTGVSKIPFS